MFGPDVRAGGAPWGAGGRCAGKSGVGFSVELQYSPILEVSSFFKKLTFLIGG